MICAGASPRPSTGCSQPRTSRTPSTACCRGRAPQPWGRTAAATRLSACWCLPRTPGGTARRSREASPRSSLGSRGWRTACCLQRTRAPLGTCSCPPPGIRASRAARPRRSSRRTGPACSRGGSRAGTPGRAAGRSRRSGPGASCSLRAASPSRPRARPPAHPSGGRAYWRSPGSSLRVCPAWPLRWPGPPEPQRGTLPEDAPAAARP
mmetsp:Transcript_72170/g.203931  ORF Transcript_72170/g.203931 Transcript_72170/m.203931 type:complete len:208 (+) Transcript_72170:1767-2390(+)